VASNAATPSLVTSANQAALTASPGKASVLVNGVAVTPQIVTASNSAAAQADPAERTPEQVRELQQAAATIETRLDTIAGGDSGVSVVRTGTGAVMTGIFSGTRVPVEDVVVVNAADTATLFAARDVRGNIVEVKPGAVLEVASNGDVAVQAFGLRPGETVELVVMSTPTLLGRFTVDAKGAIKTSTKLPTSIGSGNHSLVVASPSVKASLGLKLVKSAATLPVTGSNTNTASNWAVAVLLSGMYLVLVSRSRRRVL
jgi:LPXTG-motif cell wall-anchored protein